MSEKEMQVVVKEYLKEVKSKLPDWLKEKKEHKEILIDLEDHIWQKAEELSDMGKPTINSVQLAIDHMGAPKSIAREYKRRGTPKFYITEELWPLFTKVLIIVFIVIIAINIFSQIINVIFENEAIGDIFGNLMTGIPTGLLGAFAVITIIFVGLSMEGYFPEDFKSKKDLKDEKRQLEIAEERGLAYETKRGKPLKPFIKPVGEIIGGLFILVIGLFLVIQPIPGLNDLIHPDFLMLVRFGGLFIIAEGSLDLARGLIGNRQLNTHQIIHIITIIVKLSSISIAVLMMMHPEIFPIIKIDETTDTFKNIGIAEGDYGTFRAIAVLVITVMVLSTIENFYNIYKLEKYKV
ncbi:MAG: hypothetical protein ACFFA6_08230 [Promethearchaeota archaeon]